MFINKISIFLHKTLLFFSLTLLSVSVLAKSLSVEDFSKHREFYNVKISPDGKHLAVLANHQGSKNLIFFKTDTLQVVSGLKAGRDSQAASFYWANNERVIIQVEQTRGTLEAPINLGEIFAVNVDGKRKKMLFGYRSKGGLVYSAEGGFLLDLLPDDPKNVLIVQQSLTRNAEVIPKVEKLNIYTGRTASVKSAPGPYSRILVDHKGVPRFASSINEDHETTLYYTEGRGQKWQSFDEELQGKFTPIAFSSDNKSVFGYREQDGKPASLAKFDIAQQKMEIIFSSTRVEPTRLLMTDLNEVFGIRLDEDYPSYVYLDESSRNAKLHKALFNAFQLQSLAITSETKDGNKLVVHVSGDKNPGTFYLFDTSKMTTTPLFHASSWIKTEQLSAMEPIRLNSKDGMEVNGYMTLPKGKTKNLPLVVMPHGGPHARDYWGYDPTVQMLANAGYAVIQVNFRGSTGYGENFMEAGYGEWGAAIQQDIHLAAQYAIGSGFADKNRVCIYGASFGGYSALQSSIMYPELYKCAIGYVGVYDLPMLYKEGDIKQIKWGDAYLDKTLGTDLAAQKQQSPTYNLDKLQAPVLIIHGEDDQRAPIEHAEKLRAGLDKNDHPYEWLVKDKEGHGFYNEDNVLEANQKILAFLAKHIGA